MRDRRPHVARLHSELQHPVSTSSTCCRSRLVADEINDGFGHSDGDRCLREVAQAISDTVRRADSCFRWGGDELAVLLADIDLDEAHWVARRLEAAVSRICRRPNGASIVLSRGLRRYEDGMSPEAFLQAADEELMERKSRPLRSVAS